MKAYLRTDGRKIFCSYMTEHKRTMPCPFMFGCSVQSLQKEKTSELVGNSNLLRRFHRFSGIRSGDRRTAQLCRPKKKYRRVWIAVDRFRRRCVGFAVGSGNAKTGGRLWRSMRTGSVKLALTDHWKAYGEFLPPSN